MPHQDQPPACLLVTQQRQLLLVLKVLFGQPQQHPLPHQHLPPHSTPSVQLKLGNTCQLDYQIQYCMELTLSCQIPQQLPWQLPGRV